MMIEIILSSLAGLFLHQTRRATARLPRGWRDLTNYAVGVAGTFPLFVFWNYRLRELNGRRAYISYLLSFLSVGAGVAAGWMIDTFAENE